MVVRPASTGRHFLHVAFEGKALNDIPENFKATLPYRDYVERVEMIPMRDGVALHTIIFIPDIAKDAPILLTRTPYDAAGRAHRSISPSLQATLPEQDEFFVKSGYTRAYQDVRGKYGSEGEYVVTQPISGPLNPLSVDHTTDTWDTIEWLVKHLPQSNGRVGMIGSSYEGFTTVMALVNPHPAFKAVVPQGPLVDAWMGDDCSTMAPFATLCSGMCTCRRHSAERGW
jgi:uncharacterized protein